MREYRFLLLTPEGYLGNPIKPGIFGDYYQNLVQDKHIDDFLEELDQKKPEGLMVITAQEHTTFEVAAETLDDAIKKLFKFQEVFSEVGKKYAKSERHYEKYGALRVAFRQPMDPSMAYILREMKKLHEFSLN